MMIDSHIHFANSLEVERLNHVIEKHGLEAIALLCIPKGGTQFVEEDAFAFKRQCKVPVYVFGGLNRECFNQLQSGDTLVEEIERLMKLGCVGIKMLEGKPDVRKYHRIPDFDQPIWDAYWTKLEEEQIPVVFHVNDPEEFWDQTKVSDFAKQVGWFYDETYVNNEDQYSQIQEVLRRHPRLNILFPHFFFMSNQLDRLSNLLDTYPNIRLDITPGVELYYNLSEQIEIAKIFFNNYQDRICFGTDIGARSIIHVEEIPLSLEESDSRMKLIRNFLETAEDYILEPDGYYVREGKTTLMHGLGLPYTILEKIYKENFMKFIG